MGLVCLVLMLMLIVAELVSLHDHVVWGGAVSGIKAGKFDIVVVVLMMSENRGQWRRLCVFVGLLE
jgi:hypothetical protein